MEEINNLSEYYDIQYASNANAYLGLKMSYLKGGGGEYEFVGKYIPLLYRRSTVQAIDCTKDLQFKY